MGMTPVPRLSSEAKSHVDAGQGDGLFFELVVMAVLGGGELLDVPRFVSGRGAGDVGGAAGENASTEAAGRTGRVAGRLDFGRLDRDDSCQGRAPLKLCLMATSV
jgi:hypothetical protein